MRSIYHNTANFTAIIALARSMPKILPRTKLQELQTGTSERVSHETPKVQGQGRELSPR
jgi:hypothetical protein